MSAIFAEADKEASKETKHKAPVEKKTKAPAEKKRKAPPASKVGRPAKRGRPSALAPMRPMPSALSSNKSENPHYRTLLAYGRSPQLGKVLARHGYRLDPGSLRNVPPQGYEVLINEIEDVLDGEFQSSGANEVIKQGMRGLEFLLTKRGIKVAGTTNECFSDEHWVCLLERVKIKHGIGTMKMSPGLELALATAQIGHRVSQRNKVSDIDLSARVVEPRRKKEDNKKK